MGGVYKAYVLPSVKIQFTANGKGLDSITDITLLIKQATLNEVGEQGVGRNGESPPLLHRTP
ncbi:hypothetical protein Nos7524_3030 [Nostoc sp. PCC 7524]|nr:hypothetical protein Nos7524_3030 [Nostoc sp. PCC 7524]